MIRRNRKKRLHGFVVPAPYAGVVVLGMLLALFYVWLGCRCDSLGKDIKTLELEKTELKKQLLNEESRWTKMKSPGNLEMVLAKRKIGMAWPRQDQVIRLHERVEDSNVSVKRPGNSLTYVRRNKMAIHD